MTKRYLQERYQLDDEECAPVKKTLVYQCTECGTYDYYSHAVTCPNAPDEPEQEGEDD